MTETVGGPALRRSLGTFRLTLYGVGVIVGAGIYVLIGEVIQLVGNGAWLAFLAAALSAVPTGLSYAELSSRYPRAAGEALFMDKAFGRPLVAFAVGFLVLASGVASTAAVSHGFVSYLGEFVHVAGVWRYVAIAAFVSGLSWINHRGLEESSWLNIVCTVASVGGLLLLVGASLPQWGSAPLLRLEATSAGSGLSASALASATALSFYAYIGFEDICNVAEEVRTPQRTIPRATLLAMVICMVVYVVVCIAAVSSVPVARLATSEVPLAVVARAVTPWLPARWLSLIALFAVTNTALLNLVMASRILYGMSRQGRIPAVFGRVSAQRQTPTWGVIGAALLTTAVALTGFLRVLAEATNVVILVVFFSVNLALAVVQLRRVPPDDPTQQFFRVPRITPLLGMLVTGLLVVRFTPGAYLRAAGLLGVGALLFATQQISRSSRP